jgi:hypothetical protein
MTVRAFFSTNICIYNKRRPPTKLADHPTAIRFYEQRVGPPDDDASRDPLAAKWRRQLCLAGGVDGAGLVDISRPAWNDQRDDFRREFRQNRSTTTQKAHQ